MLGVTFGTFCLRNLTSRKDFQFARTRFFQICGKEGRNGMEARAKARMIVYGTFLSSCGFGGIQKNLTHKLCVESTFLLLSWLNLIVQVAWLPDRQKSFLPTFEPCH